jgi:hypothetical protein
MLEAATGSGGQVLHVNLDLCKYYDIDLFAPQTPSPMEHGRLRGQSMKELESIKHKTSIKTYD